MDQLRALRYFSKVAETGSFSRAAEAFSVRLLLYILFRNDVLGKAVAQHFAEELVHDTDGGDGAVVFLSCLSPCLKMTLMVECFHRSGGNFRRHKMSLETSRRFSNNISLPSLNISGMILVASFTVLHGFHSLLQLLP